MHALIRALETRSTQIAAMKLMALIPNAPLSGTLINLANDSGDLDRVARAIDVLVSKAGLTVADAKTTLCNLLAGDKAGKKVGKNFYGQFCELGAYEWLDRHRVAFNAQIPLTGAEVLNPNGCTIDGRINVIDAYFDVKAMGFQIYVAEMFREQLAQLLGGLSVTIDGPMDVEVKEIETHAFGQLKALTQKLAKGGIENIPQLGWTICAAMPRCVTTTVHTTNPYCLAEKNRYFPLKTARQFARNKPFLLVFAYAAQFNHALFLNFAESTDITLRALARRVFIQLTSDPTPANLFDQQVPPQISVADAARLISGLLFINLDGAGSCLFLNPRATHPLTRDHAEQMFDFTIPTHLSVDDFAWDNY